MINIVAACDDNYAQHLSVMLVSLLENNPNQRFRIFLLTTANPEALRKISESCEGYAHCRLEPRRVDPGLLESAPVSGHITQAAYYRLLLGEILPLEVRRVLYLDSDIVVVGSIADLWSADLGSNVVGAVQDDVFNGHPDARARLGLPHGEDYFNSGVLLIDLERWRRERVGHAALAFARDEPQRITWHDQCALNFVLRGRWLPLERKWNFQTPAIGGFTAFLYPIATDEGLEGLRRAVIVHFSSRAKPWNFLCGHPAKSRYWHYLRKTAWRNYRMPDVTMRNVVRDFLIRHCLPVLRAYWRLRR